jgi:hypothetical protein
VRKWPIKPDISTIVSENLYFKPIKNAKMRKKREKRKDFILTTSGGITGNENVFYGTSVVVKPCCMAGFLGLMVVNRIISK